jgi:hypothetical protein
MGKPSFEALSANAGDCAGLRIVARTLWPARAKANAASKPIPLLVPVINIVANVFPFKIEDDRKLCGDTAWPLWFRKRILHFLGCALAINDENHMQ